jgi:glycosyltransferase involved in cell wall biosynthesis
MPDVLMILKCNGLQYDDRVRKECESLKSCLDYDTEIHVVEDDNSKRTGAIFGSQTQFKSYFLLTRKLFSGNSLLLVKLCELFFKLLPTLIKKRKVIWLHDPLMFVFVPFIFLLKKTNRVEHIVWDQHELPPEYFISSPITCYLYKVAMKLVDVRIHANKQRAEYLNKLLGKDYSYHILNNFVDVTFVVEKSQPLSSHVCEWLDGDDYVLLQSGAYHERNFEHVVNAFMIYGKQKCMVVGGSRVDLALYRTKYENFDDIFFFVGMVPQIRLVDYIDNAKASLILYKSTIPNAYYCEPNRLYQASCRGTFVIVGNNPPMADFVNDNQNGFVLNSDGSNKECILCALNYINENKIEEKTIVSDWACQNDVFASCLIRTT